MLELNTAIHTDFQKNFKPFLFSRIEGRVSSGIRDKLNDLAEEDQTLTTEEDQYKILSASRLLSSHLKNLLTIAGKIRETRVPDGTPFDRQRKTESTRGLFNALTRKRKEFISLLFGDDVIGAINTKQRCPSCKGNFSSIDNTGLYCPKCKTRPTRYYITARKIGIPFLYSTPIVKEPFETYSQAMKALVGINHSYQEAISQGKKFDVSEWLPSDNAEKLIENLCPRWLKNYKPEVDKGVKSKDYVDSLHTICNAFIVPFFKGKHVEYISENDIEKFYHWLLDKTYSSSYIHSILSVLHTIFKKYRSDDIPPFPKFAVVPVKEKQRLGLAREMAILEHVSDRNGYRLAILILLRTGMRLNEVVAVKKKDFVDGIIHIYKVLSDKRLKLRRKNGGSVPYRLTNELWQLALTHMKDLDDDDFVFTVNGENLTTGRLYKVWKKACKKSGQKHISLQNASRHSKASEIWEEHQQRAKEEIQRQLGHHNTQTGKKHYVIE